MRRVRLTGSSTALSFAHAIRPQPRVTPHSTTDTLTGSARLNTSYRARKRVRCWRRTYLVKFSSRVATGSVLSRKILSSSSATMASCGVRRGFASFFSVLCDIAVADLAALPAALDARLLGPLRRPAAGRGLQRSHERIGSTLGRELLEACDRPVEVGGTEPGRWQHPPDPRGGRPPPPPLAA